MGSIDWIVLITSLIFIVLYGVWKGKGSRNIHDYLLANRELRWYTVLFSIMATQASAITFLSVPGQAYTDGVRFVQFYLGLPLAMIILSITAVPLYHKLNVYTAYEFLETRLDVKTRILAALLFLTQRGLAAGLTIFAPSLILSLLLGWNLYLTNLFIGILVIIYTASGGTKAVSFTHFFQMLIILLGMGAAFWVMLQLLPKDITFFESVSIAGKMGKLNAMDFTFDLDNRYNFWSGILGGLFLQLSYFGTDQSQVQRYLTGKSVTHSRLALLMNGIVKIPMQFSILFIGAILFVFYQFQTPPIFFNKVEAEKVKKGEYSQAFEKLEREYQYAHIQKKQEVRNLVEAFRSKNKQKIDIAQEKLQEVAQDTDQIRSEAIQIIQKNNPDSNPSDTNFIFLTFVINFLPMGLVGLMLAVIFAASMSSTSAELNALASTTIVDGYKRLFKKNADDKHYLIASKIATILWGTYAILLAESASRLGSLIEAVNIVGSLFYGTILGIFLVAFYIRNVSGTATFYGAILAEVLVLCCFFFTNISFLWYNVVGCLGVILLAQILGLILPKIKSSKSN
jgi:SSS family solute:Na+ symporter